MKMDWTKLVSFKRFGDTSAKGLSRVDVDARNEFERDIDRVIYSFPFRRLQGKTQVFPVPKSDFVHTRLTHSLEVAAAGRSLGKLAGQFIVEREGQILDRETRRPMRPGYFGNILAASCLAHDIGNPPIGHSGEDAFRSFFKSKTDDLANKFQLTQAQIQDFINFEGNANGFRILSNDHPSGVYGGLRMTYTTLGAFAKYPKQSGEISFNELGEKNGNRVSQKKGKFGFFTRELPVFREVAEYNGLLRLSDKDWSWCRHPLAFLVEAADTICYSCIDIEDGFHLNYVSYDELKDILLPLATKVVDKDPCDPEEELTKITGDEDKVGFLRSRAINNLMFLSLEVFKNNYDKIMEGIFDEELTDSIAVHRQFAKLKDFNKERLYNTSKGVQIEIAGYTILGGLLGHFFQALETPNERRSKKILNLLAEHVRPSTIDPYLNILRVCDFVAGMTDQYAIDIFGKLTGTRFPVID